MNNMKVGIVGLGMMGCSLAYLLKNKNNISSIFGCDINISMKELHQNDIRFIDEIYDFDEICEIVDVLFLIIPPKAIINNMNKIKDKTNITIIDFASIKNNIVINIPPKIRKNFIATHPMCGNEKSGPNGYEKNLYQNKTLIICQKEENDTKHINRAIEIFEFLQMNISFMDAITHDEHIGYISHLPHIVSFALANSVLNQKSPQEIVNLRGGGFDSMVRLAKSSSFLWKDIFEENAQNLSIALEEYEKELAIFKQYLANKDFDNIQKWIQKANKMQDIL
jgi:prephenate dehydrogenase